MTDNSKQKYTTLEHLTYGGIALGFVSLIVLMAFEIPYFSRTLDAKQLVYTALGVGFVFGLIWAFLWRGKAKNATEKIQIFSFCILLSMFFAPLFVSMSNRMLSSDLQKEKITVLDIDKRYTEAYGSIDGKVKQPNLFVVVFERKGEIVNFKSRNPQFVNVQNGNVVEVEILQGTWGFCLVEE